MSQSRVKIATLARWQSSKRSDQYVGATSAVPYVIVLALLALISIVWGIKDPLLFTDIFGRM
jgi:hypothetical protein